MAEITLLHLLLPLDLQTRLYAQPSAVFLDVCAYEKSTGKICPLKDIVAGGLLILIF